MKRISSILLLLVMVLSLTLLMPFPTTFAQVAPTETTPNQKAITLFSTMSPAERVGQLFLVSFEGNTIDINSKILDLIINYHIGGIILSAQNNNFIGPENTIPNTVNLVSELQKLEWYSAHPEEQDTYILDQNISNYIPLFMAISQEGDSSPNSQILSGLTPIPDLMAIGATWSPELSRRVGEVLGSELSTLGFNMLFGPSLDVLDYNYSTGKEGLGVRSFGENPYWVGELGAAYIEGVHNGSDDQILVIAKHFPGQGSSDRNPSNEVATVLKPYNLLVKTDLAPFMAVTGNAKNQGSVTDGLLAAHIRYESLQGTIRNTTRPFSFDTAAIDQLLALPALASWRQNGGIIVSDNLGSQAVKKFYDPNGTLFDARQVARNAINAGIDLLYLNDFISTGDIDQYTTIIRTHEFFLQKYLEDEAFAQQVNTSVIRLLEKKFTLYPDFELDQVLPDLENLNSLNLSSPIMFEVAQQGVTLLNPRLEELGNSIPNPPGISDRTVFFTDLKMFNQCSECPDLEMIPSDALRKSVIRLYGPEAGADVAQYLLSTFSFADLANLLDGVGDTQIVEEELKAANWVVFALLDSDPTRPSSLALKRLLAERPELLTNKYSIAFAFNGPNYLDATEISKLSAYYAVYSKIPSFTEVAARILFQEIIPSGALPVSLPAIGYDVAFATSPDPNQTIPLMLDASSTVYLERLLLTPTVEILPESTAVPSFETGDTLPLITGVIYDRNHHRVPDETVVTFLFTLEGETRTVQQIESLTKNGVAQAEFLIQSEGKLEINVLSGEATNSEKLALNISQGKAAVITVIVPTPTSTVTPSPTPIIPTVTPTPSQTPTIVPPVPKKTSGSDWLLSMVITWSLSAVIYAIGRQSINLRWGIRWGLLATFGGMVAYTFLSMKFPGNSNFLEYTGTWGISLSVMLGLAVGWLSGWLWYRYSQRKRN